MNLSKNVILCTNNISNHFFYRLVTLNAFSWSCAFENLRMQAKLKGFRLTVLWRLLKSVCSRTWNRQITPQLSLLHYVPFCWRSITEANYTDSGYSYTVINIPEISLQFYYLLFIIIYSVYIDRNSSLFRISDFKKVITMKI